jgi:hypothetical protein
MNISSFRRLGAKIFEGWTDLDPTGSIAALAKLPVEDERAAFLGIARARDASLEPAAVHDAIRAMPDGEQKLALIGRVAGDWAREEPQAAAAWIDSLDGFSPSELFCARGEIAEQWMRYDRSAALQIGAWFLSGTQELYREEIAGAIADKFVKEAGER